MLLDMFRLTDRVAIVTGSGRAIGRAIALGMADAGAHVVVAEINPETAAATAAEVRARGRRALVVPADVTQRSAAHEMVGLAQREFGRVDILVNNAGGHFHEEGVAAG